MLEQRIDDKPFLRLMKKWLKAGILEEDGKVLHPATGTPQGGVVSPLLANLFLHSAFDRWMQRTSPHLPFERYADEAMVHGRTETEAQEVRRAMAERMQECRLEGHPDKTKIVSCKDEDRRGTYPHEQFDCLG